MTPDEVELQKNDKEKFYKLRDSVRQEVEDSIKIALIIEAVAIKEKVVVLATEVEAALKYQAAMSGQDEVELIKYHKENNLMTSVKTKLTEDKLLRQLLKLDK
jgi:FKBP-type peptidyl-prolyl cis-trans isomerase (trigger factor)